MYDPQQAGIAALVARLDARATKPVAKEKADSAEPAPVPARPTLKDAQ